VHKLVIRKTQQYQISPGDEMVYRYDANVKLPGGQTVRLHLMGNVEFDNVADIIFYGQMYKMCAAPSSPPEVPPGVIGKYL
jgi:hypothetical protein